MPGAASCAEAFSFRRQRETTLLNGNGEIAPARANGGNGAGRPWRGEWQTRSAAMAEAQKLVEGTIVPQTTIARTIGISPRTLSDWRRAGGWMRPEGAPDAPLVRPADTAAGDGAATEPLAREQLVERLFAVFNRQLNGVEARARSAGVVTQEKDARTLGTLARTLGTLMALERGGSDQPDDPEAEAVDPDEIRARIARRLFGMRGEGDV